MLLTQRRSVHDPQTDCGCSFWRSHTPLPGREGRTPEDRGGQLGRMHRSRIYPPGSMAIQGEATFSGFLRDLEKVALLLGKLYPNWQSIANLQLFSLAYYGVPPPGGPSARRHRHGLHRLSFDPLERNGSQAPQSGPRRGHGLHRRRGASQNEPLRGPLCVREHPAAQKAKHTE